jgi:hypothetical protein
MQAQSLLKLPYASYIAMGGSLILGLTLKDPLTHSWNYCFNNTSSIEEPLQLASAKTYDKTPIHELFAQADALFHENNVDEAIKQYKQILLKDNSSILALIRLGAALCKKENYELAEFYYRTAVSLHPGFILSYIKLGLVQHRLKKYNDALRTFAAVIALQPNNFEAHFNASKVYSDLQNFDRAIAHAKKSIEMQPTNVHTHLNLGHIYNKQGDTHSAIKQYEKAIELEPELANAHYNLGYTLRVQREPKKALPHLFRALELQPEYPDAHIALAQAYWTFGDFKTAWKHYDWRWKQLGIDPKTLGTPLWDGSPLNGKKILLYAEQGMGDTLQFIRYAKLVKDLGGYVICKAQKPLDTILKSCPYIDELARTLDANTQLDVQAPLLNLPGILNTTVETIPHPIPYLFADKKLSAQWKQKLASDKNFKIGLAWHVLPEHENSKSPISRRSIPLKLLAPLADIKGVSFYSLQKFDGVEQVLEQPEHFNVKTFGHDFDESNGRFMDTAALIDNLDLIISADTSIIHLAAGMGKNVWTFLPYSPDCRWDLHEDTTPWYQTMRLFRQQTVGDWESVVARIKTALEETIKK